MSNGSGQSTCTSTRTPPLYGATLRIVNRASPSIGGGTSTWQSAFRRANQRCAKFGIPTEIHPHTLRHNPPPVRRGVGCQPVAGVPRGRLGTVTTWLVFAGSMAEFPASLMV